MDKKSLFLSIILVNEGGPVELLAANQHFILTSLILGRGELPIPFLACENNLIALPAP